MSFTNQSMVDKSSRTTVNLESTPRTIIPQKKVIGKEIPQTPAIDLDPHLNPEYNFETFIEGYSNKLSRSVAEAVALNPAKTIFNPLFFYGASGVGKTHLSNAIGTKIKEIYPDKRVLYVSAHLFQVQYTDSVRNNTTNDFINFYQSIDILIIDDIQEFAGVTKTQNTFFHIFNHLHQNGKQLILTSDRSPALLQGMPIEQVIKLVGSLQLDSESINTWKNGVERALKKYITDGTEAKGKKCPNCGNETLVYQEGCLICTTCGSSRCG